MNSYDKRPSISKYEPYRAPCHYKHLFKAYSRYQAQDVHPHILYSKLVRPEEGPHGVIPLACQISSYRQAVLLKKIIQLPLGH